MKNFDIAKYLREHQLGSYGILNHYVDLKPLKEEEDTTEVELNTEIPYEGPEHKLTGNGEGDEFEQAETVSEEFEETFSERGTNRLDFPAMENTIQSIVDDLVDDGFPVEEVEQHLKDLISNAVAPYK